MAKSYVSLYSRANASLGRVKVHTEDVITHSVPAAVN
jgi:hypothetical protein